MEDKPKSPYNRARQKVEKARQAAAQAKAELATLEKAAEIGGLRLPTKLEDAHERREIEKARNKGGRPKNDKYKVILDGHAVVAKNAKSLLEILVGYASDPKSEHHFEALKMLAERILPAGYFKALGEQMVNGEKQAQGGIIINVQGITPIHLGEAKTSTPALPDFVDVESEPVEPE